MTLTQIRPVVSAPAARTGGAGVVVIGRNEGERLMACLGSLARQPRPVMYVDSGSTDGSPDRARERGVSVLQLDPSQPFSAARARNEGAQALFAQNPHLTYVQFVDGDCIVAPGWLDAAEAALDAHPDSAIVFGDLTEKNPQGSVYNLLCALEWRSPSGPVDNMNHLLGVTMVRRSVFEQVGGFNAECVAGEDPEFGVRVGLAGHRARKISAPMALHDAAMLHFSQWWKRSVRAGHAIGQRAHLHGNGPLRHGARERLSSLFWGFAMPATALLSAPATQGLSLVVMLAGYGLLFWRIARFRLRMGDAGREAALYAAFTIMGKFANVQGLLKYQLNRLRGRIRIIEYK
jgi:GT2 family glycosyltransferase